MSHPFIASIGRALPRHSYAQRELSDALLALWEPHPGFTRARVEALHGAVKVERRHLALPKEAYPPLDTFEKRNQAWIREAQALGEAASREAMARAGVTAADVDVLCFTTITGLATPSIDARLVNTLGLRPDVRRLPLFGLGCVAGVAGTARVCDVLRGDPGATALFLSVELCSLTIQRDDLSVSSVIAAGLFGDGASAMVLKGSEGRASGPRVVASRSVFYPHTEQVMGWDFLDSGFRVVLSADVPGLVLANVRRDVDAFLAEHRLVRGDIHHWVAHTGGPKVLEALERSLELPQDGLARSWASLKAVGNLSSCSVLFVLADLLESRAARPGDLGVMIAMGPGFCAELVLLQW